MNQTLEGKPPIWFWVIGGLALVWNLMGVGAYISQVTMSAEALAKLSEADQAALASLPSWYLGAFAVAVFGGALGCLALLIRKKWAMVPLVLSLAAVLLQQLYFFVLTDLGSKQHGGQLVMTLAIPVVALLLVLFARSSSAKGYLR